MTTTSRAAKPMRMYIQGPTSSSASSSSLDDITESVVRLNDVRRGPWTSRSTASLASGSKRPLSAHASTEPGLPRTAATPFADSPVHSDTSSRSSDARRPRRARPASVRRSQAATRSLFRDTGSHARQSSPTPRLRPSEDSHLLTPSNAKLSKCGHSARTPHTTASKEEGHTAASRIVASSSSSTLVVGESPPHRNRWWDCA
mmetsp:Transcript_4372/g.13662  ORF Transcript_4372/g.13662 Transcript_4372/m.13662 type:complete len:202 (-) Transcript_4372:650-1255(-)